MPVTITVPDIGGAEGAEAAPEGEDAAADAGASSGGDDDVIDAEFSESDGQ